MKHVPVMIGVLALGLWAADASASETTIDFQGTVVATPDPTQAFDLSVGSPVYFSVTFDPDKLVDVSQTFYNIDAITGMPVAIPGLETASLSDDPNAAFTVTAGSHSFTKFDAHKYGQNLLGAGDVPLAVFQNSTFVGVAFEAIADDGFVIDTDPIAVALHYFPTYGVGFDINSNNPDFGFLISTDLPSLYAAVPEPASWATMIAGFGMIGGALRRGRTVLRDCAV